MKKLVGILALLAAFALPALAQYASRLAPDDQREFDRYYSKWVNDTRKNDRDDIASDVGHMQEIMSRNNIPANVPFDQIASPGMAYPSRGYQGQLPAQDQGEFDKHYKKWVDATRKNDRDDIAKEESHMREIMGRNNIPPNTPFDQVASGGYANGGYSNNGYPNNGYQNYGPPNNGYAYQSRLPSDDQREFDKYYSKWLKDTRKNDRDDIDKDARHMQDIMARNNIPANVPYDQVASPDAARH